MDDLTEVELYWQKGRIERWIRFGRIAQERISTAVGASFSFSPGSIFAFVRWAANEHGTIASRIDILRAAQPGKTTSFSLDDQHTPASDGLHEPAARFIASWRASFGAALWRKPKEGTMAR
jgi:hypothetical protein